MRQPPAVRGKRLRIHGVLTLQQALRLSCAIAAHPPEAEAA
jgi:hypothetical protein